MRIIDFERMETTLEVSQRKFAEAKPFPHIVVDDFLETEACDVLLEEFEHLTDDKEWSRYSHYNERKRALTRAERMGLGTKSIIAELSSPRFLAWLEAVSEIHGLVADPDLDGGGLHQIERGGYLNIHADYLSHTVHSNWSRQINLLLFLNRNWREEYKGALEFWDSDMTRKVEQIEPLFNRCIVFHTTDKTYHGHPTPLDCPEGMSRKSLALYYFRDEKKKLRLAPTHYRARPEETAWKHTLVAVDREALRAYSVLKRYTGLRDRHFSAVVRAFRKGR